MTKPVLDIQLLGDFRLVCDGEVLTCSHSPRLQSLVAYLVLHRGTPQVRQQIAFLFWPDSSEDRARTSFRQLLFELRRWLPNTEHFLDADGPLIQWLDDAPTTLDVDEFTKACTEATVARRSGRSDDAETALQRAVTLYRGDLLPSCYDDWIVPEREALRDKFVFALQTLVDIKEESGHLREAITHAQLLLRYDPISETVYRDLMRLHALSGDRAGVLRVYKTCVKVLQRELAAEPSAETQAEYERRRQATRPAPAQKPKELSVPRIRPHHLPFPLTPFIGREREARQVRGLVAAHRLVTLMGIGGVGKTRLAMRVAADVIENFPDGVWWIDLASLSDPTLVPTTIAAALGVDKLPEARVTETLAHHLGIKRLLIVLDGCEHLHAAVAPLVRTLLESTPKVQALTTSQVRLGIPGEVTWRVPPLATAESKPLPPTRLVEVESVQLFVDRAAAVLPTFQMTDDNLQAAALICRRLDGIPLAIELAATQVTLLTPRQIAARLDHCFDMLAAHRASPLSRYQTLRATMDWSYQLLSERAQVLLRRLAIFAGSFTLEAVEAVCADEDDGAESLPASTMVALMAEVMDKSLVVLDEGGTEATYRMLDVVRQYAYEKLLQSGEMDRLCARHLDFYLQVAEQGEPNYGVPDLSLRKERLVRSLDNLRAAVARSSPDSAVREKQVRLTVALRWFWREHGSLKEGHAWAQRALALTEGMQGTLLRAKALLTAGIMAYFRLENDLARQHSEASAALFKEVGPPGKRGLLEVTSMLGLIAGHRGDTAAARAFFREQLALAQELKNDWYIASALASIGYGKYLDGDHEGGRADLAMSLAIARAVGDQKLIDIVLRRTGLAALEDKDYGTARTCFRQVLDLCRSGTDRWTIFLTFGYLLILEPQVIPGGFLKAARLGGAREALAESIGVSTSSVSQWMQALQDRSLIDIREQLGDTVFTQAWNEGRAMALEQAVEYALKDD